MYVSEFSFLEGFPKQDGYSAYCNSMYGVLGPSHVGFAICEQRISAYILQIRLQYFKIL